MSTGVCLGQVLGNLTRCRNSSSAPPLPRLSTKAGVALRQGRRRHNHWNRRREIRRRAIEVSQIHAPHQPRDFNGAKAAASRSGPPQLAAPVAPTAVSAAVHRG